MTREQIKNIPKAELHLHFEGTLPFKLLQELNPGKYTEEPIGWKDDYRCPNFEAFDHYLLGMAGDYFTSVKNYQRAAKIIFAEALENSTRYMEISIASGSLDYQNLDGEKVCNAIKEVVPPGLTVKLFMGIHHSGFTEKMTPILEDSLLWSSIDGYDLHGVEYEPLDPPIVDFWNKAREAGKQTKAHAGEFCGADFVHWALDELGVTRLEHGIRSTEDPELLKEMAKRDIVCDICPISNVKLQSASSYEDHPIKELIAAGVKCTISRDDPLCFGNTIIDDYTILQEKTGLSDGQIVQLVRNGLEAACVEEKTKKIWRKELCDYLIEQNLL